MDRIIYFAVFASLILKYNAQDVIEVDVLILGGGAAGAAAAVTLEGKGVENYLILEATDRIGGRMKSGTIGNYTVELGAAWMHGAHNALLPFADRYGLEYMEQDYSWYVSDEEGNNVTEVADAFLDVYEEAAENLDESSHIGIAVDWPDMNKESGLALYGVSPQTTVEMAVEYYVQDYEDAVPPIASGSKYDNIRYAYWEGDADYIVLHQENGGFVHLLRSIMEERIPDWESKVHFNTVVNAIEYTDEDVTVHTSQGTYKAKNAIMTFSLGVLKKEVIQFNPPLPGLKRQAIFGMQFTYYKHLYLRFPEDEPWFFPDVEYIVYSGKSRGYYTAWQNFERYLPGSRILEAALVSYEAIRVNNMTDEEVMAEMTAVLRNMFGNDVPDPVEILRSDWISDPFTYGSYSNWPPGYTKEQHDNLKASLGRLHFAGEAYSYKFYGYIQGAMQTGVKAARKVSRDINAGNRHVASFISYMLIYFTFIICKTV